MKKEIEVTLTLPDKWVGKDLSLTEAVDYCQMAIASYSEANTFDEKAKLRQYVFCKTMLSLAQLNHATLIAVKNESKEIRSFRLSFDNPSEYTLFDKGFINLLKSCGYKTPEEPN